MNKFVLISAQLMLVSGICMAEVFIMPPLDARYDQVTWLSTHNAYANQNAGYVYANQYYSLKDQLERGVRAFDLDTYEHCTSKKLGIFGKEKCSVNMCHGDCAKVNKWIYKPLSLGDDALDLNKDGLQVFKKFLEPDKSAIITIMLENYASWQKIDKAIEDAGIQNLVLKPSEWNPADKKGWPTLKWLIDNNKRIIVFNSKLDPAYKDTINSLASSKYTYYQWSTMSQNQWGGAKDINKALNQREVTKQFNNRTRYLLGLDWFADGGKILGGGPSDLVTKVAGLFKTETPFGGDFGKLNGPDLENFINRVVQQGLNPSGLAKGRYPNFIKVDFFHEGNPTPLSLVNKINQMAADSARREQMFKPMPAQ